MIDQLKASLSRLSDTLAEDLLKARAENARLEAELAWLAEYDAADWTRKQEMIDAMKERL